MENTNTAVSNDNEQKIVAEIINDMVEEYNISKNYSAEQWTENVDPDLPPNYDPTNPNNTTNQYSTEGLNYNQVDINSANSSGSGLLVPQSRPLPQFKLFRIIGSYRKGVLQFVVEELRRLGFRLAHPSVPFEQIHVFWSRSFTPHLPSLRSHQKVNFLPAMAEVCRKDFLNRNIRKARAKYPNHAEIYNFWPIGFNLPHEIEEMKTFVEEQKGKGNLDMTGPFILKPPLAARGEGIRLVANVDEVDLNDPWYAEKIPLAQLYVKDPLLIEGFKITFRIYAALTSLDPTVVYVYPGGLGRICSEKYKLELDSLKNLEIHLTNYDLNVHNEQNFNEKVGNSIQHDGLRVDLEYFFDYLKERNRITEEQIEYVWQQIKSLVGKTFISSESIISLWVHRKVPKRSNSFELTGFDILIDSSFKVWLLEVNHTPSLSPHTELENKLKRVMIRDLLQLVDIENKTLRQISQEADRKYAYVCKLNEESPAVQTDPLINEDGTVNIKKLTRIDIVAIVSTEIQDQRKGLWQRAFPIAEAVNYVSAVENRRSRLLVHWFANNMNSNECLLPPEERPVKAHEE